ncbi:hypothetical protein GCM10009809_37820 [Isoptericola hypogeus]|uniref:CHAT domain-containing protein n=1 Tax=Isoptericola hypogeus TaxID=300179 RepID=A0ABN2JTX7_9MICO
MVQILELEISRGTDRHAYTVQVLRSPAGEASAEVTLDSGELLDRRQKLQEAVLLSSVSSRSTVSSSHEGVVRAVGRTLFDVLFGPASISSLYAASRALADANHEDLRVVLRTGSAELAALPWEVMYDTDADAYVCRRQPLVRHIPVANAPSPLRVQGALRILGIVSSPRGMEMLDVEREKENLTSALARPIERGLVDLRWAPDATWRTLQDLLLSQEWHVVHFIGHGDFDFECEEGILVLVGTDGRPNRVEARRIVDLLRQSRPMPRLVVLNACSSATSNSENLFSGTAAALVRGGVSAVAAMQFEITDHAAIEFCRGFYNAIAYGRGIDEAMGSGRVAILGSGRETLEWVTPVLYLRGLTSQLFSVDQTPRAGHEAEALDNVMQREPTEHPLKRNRSDEGSHADDVKGTATSAGSTTATHGAARKGTDSAASADANNKKNLELLRARARELAWWNPRPSQVALEEIGDLLAVAEVPLGAVGVPGGWASDIALVVTDRCLYLCGPADSKRWHESWNTFPASAQPTNNVVRIPIERVEACEIVPEIKILRIRWQGFAASLKTPAERSVLRRLAVHLEVVLTRAGGTAASNG